MFRSALVALRPETSNEQLLQYAVELARRYSLHLSGASVLDRSLLSPPEAVPLGGMAFKAELDEARVARVRAQMESTIGEFNRHCSVAGVSSDFTCTADEICPEISHAFQRHDVLLLGHPEEQTLSGPRRDSAALQMILRGCPGPVIVVPDHPSPQATSVVVAYDGGTQASRALKSFIASGFHADSTIHVVAFDNELELAGQLASSAVDLLTQHGYRAVAAPGLIPTGAPLSALIQAACEDHGAKLLVMGAYSKPAYRAFFLGSVTNSLLAEIRLPMFIDH